jgi:hypothetical protein
MPQLNELLSQLESEQNDRFNLFTQLLAVNDPDHQFELEAEKSAFFVDYNYEIGSSSFSIGDFYYNELISKGNLGDILSYWNRRRLESTNPIMKFTYSILLWELKTSLPVKTIIPEVVQGIADTAIQIASLVNSGLIMHDIMFYLNYALSITLKAKQMELSNKLKDSIMSFCGRKDLFEKQGIWYPVFLYLLSNKTILGLSDQEIKSILDFINELLHLDQHPNEIIRIGESLCNYYSKSQDVTSIRVVLDTVYNRLQKYGSSALGTAVLYLGFQKIVNNYGYPELSLKITHKMESNGKKILGEMNTHVIEFPQEVQDEMENWKMNTKQKITDLLSKYDFDEVFSLIVVARIPLKEAIIKDKETNSSICERFPSIVAQINVNSEGLPVTSNAEIMDEESELIKWLVDRTFKTGSFFFRFWFRELFTQFKESQDGISNLVSSSTYLKERHKEIINRGLQYYFANDYIAAIHLFIPQIEDVLRTIVELKGGVVIKPNKVGGYDKKNLDELLRSDELKTILDDSFLLYMKALLSHRRGYNLRNEVCHGLVDSFTDLLSLRLMHIISYLALLDI